MKNNNIHEFLEDKVQEARSLIKDKDGNPVVFYHGTNRRFEEYSHCFSKHRQILNDKFQGDWICYSPEENVAWQYTDSARNQCLDKDIFLREAKEYFQSKSTTDFGDYLYKLTEFCLNEGRSEGWVLIEDQYSKDKNISKGDHQALRAFFVELDAFTKENPDFQIDEFLDTLEYVEYSATATPPDNQLMNIFSNTIDSMPEYIVEYLEKLGFEKSLPEPKVFKSHIYASKVLETSDREEAQKAKNQGYDLVIYSGPDCVDGEPEYLIANPEQVDIQEVVIEKRKRVYTDEIKSEWYEESEREIINLKEDKDLKEQKEDFVNTYGYGDCFVLAMALSKEFDLDLGVVETCPSGIPVHAFVVDKGYAIDAHGKNPIEEIFEKYKGFITEYPDEGEMDFQLMGNREGINHLSYYSGEGLERESEALSCFKEIYPEICESLRNLSRKNKLRR